MKIKVDGMSCTHCASRVKNELLSLGATDIEVDLDNKTVSFCGDIEEEEIKKAINSLGFIYKGKL